MPANDSLRVTNSLTLTPGEVAATARSTPHPARRARRGASSPAEARPLSWGLTEAALVAAVVALALALRFWNLTAIPFGLHGDEAVVGLEGGRILREGYIGPYSGEALGQPTGPLYLAALAVRLFGNTIFAVRAVAALAGTLTVLALYLVMRRSFGVPTALIGATLLATLSWHVHFARLGFPLETWPLCIVLTAGATVEALRRNDWRWWLAAGVLAGGGVYSYNAHPLFLAILALFVAIAVIQGFARDGRHALAPRLLGPALMAVAIIATAWPLIAYARVPEHDYFSHAKAFSIFRHEAWTDLQTTGDRAAFLGDRYRDYWDRVCCHPDIDGADGTGLTPLAQPVLLLLAGVGAIYGLWRRRSLVVLALLVILVMPVASVITIDGLARRTFAIAPFLAILGALPLGWLAEFGAARWRTTRAFGRALPVAIFSAMLALLLAVGPYSLSEYFRAFVPSTEHDWTFNSDYHGAIQLMNTLPSESYVYFFAERWPLGYETRLYLAPQVRGEDRSKEYGARTDLARVDDEPIALFILFGRYTELIDQLRSQYPGGTTIQGRHNGKETFVAYRIDRPGTSGQVP